MICSPARWATRMGNGGSISMFGSYVVVKIEVLGPEVRDIGKPFYIWCH